MANALRIYFEDNGQDFLYWDVDLLTNMVIDCQPFKASVWCDNYIDNHLPDLEKGDHLTFVSKRDGKFYNLNHAVEKVELISKP